MAIALQKNLILAFRDQNNSFKISFQSSRYDLYQKIQRLRLTQFQNTLQRSQIYKMSTVITSQSFTHRKQKDTFTSQFAQGALIAALFQSFEVSFQNISPFSSRIKPKLFETLSDVTESKAQRNQLSLQATTSSGISHF